VKGLRDLLLEFWDPLHILGTVEARNLRFGMQNGAGGPKRNNAKLGKKGVVKWSRDLLLQFWDPHHISETVEARNFKFGTQIGH